MFEPKEPKSEYFQSCQHDSIKRHGSGGAANHVVVKSPFWFFVVNGPRGHRGPRVIGSGFSFTSLGFSSMPFMIAFNGRKLVSRSLGRPQCLLATFPNIPCV